MRNRVVEEISWEERDDARTLANAIEIRADKERYAKAVKAAQIMSMQADNEANAMKKVAGGRIKNMDRKARLQETLRATIASL